MRSLSAFLFILLICLAFGRGGGGCFLPGTEILTSNGPLPIEDISLGQDVLSFSEDQIFPATVSEIYEVERNYYYTIKTNESEVNTTAEHPFYIGNNQFREVEQLDVGDTIYLLNDSDLVPEEILEIYKVNESTKAYNLRVDGPHTFFANYFAVHNKGGCFQGDTQISCPSGSKNISEIAPGDEVYSFFRGVVVPSTVENIYSLQVEEYYTIQTESSEVNVTAEHPFYTDSGFVTAQDLHVGDYVYALINGDVQREEIIDKTLVQKPLIVYNLQIDRPHTFFANGFAVHNKGGGGGGGGGFSGGSSRKSSPPDNLKFYDCNALAENKSDCCALVSSTYKSISPVTSYPLSSLAPSSFNSNAYCMCRTGSGGWRNSSTFNSSYTECSCTNRPEYDPVTVNKCIDYFGLGCVGLFAIFFLLTFFGQAAAWLFALLKLGGFAKGSGTWSSSDWSSTISVPQDKVYQKSKKVSALLSLWGRADPVWKEEKLKEDANKIFLKLQECWGERDYTEMKDLMMPELYGQHVEQLKAMKIRHEINKMEDLKLLDLQLVLVSNYHDVKKDEFIVWIKATARDTIIDDRTGNKIRGDVTSGIFEEFWAFKRDDSSWKLKQVDQPEEGMDVITKENLDTLFTPAMMSRVYEKAGGPEIKKLGVIATREREDAAAPAEMDKIKWKSERVHRLLNFLSQEDKLWDEIKLSTYVRSIFITFNVSVETRDLESVKANLWPELYDKYNKLIRDLTMNKQRIEKRNLAVRNVEIVLVRNYYDNRKDEFTAWVSGQAQNVIVAEATGSVIEGDGLVADFEEFWTFQRDGDQWKVREIEKGYQSKAYVEEENFEEGADKTMLDWYYTRERGI